MTEPAPEYAVPPGFADFARKCLLFGLPIVLITALPLLVLLLSGESLTPLEQIAELYDTQPALVGFAYNEQNYPWLKFRRLSSLPRRTVVALGSSRVLTFREGMFTQPFYNAGYTIQSAADFRTLLQQLPTEQLPAILLIGLDQWMFNPQWNSGTPPAAPTHWTSLPSDSLRAALQKTPGIYKDLARGRISLPAVFRGRPSVTARPDIVRCGLNGVVNNKGFRGDGSFHYGLQIQQLLANDSSVRDYQFADTLARVRDGDNRFNTGDAVDTAAIQQIADLLTYCQQQSMHVVAFLPPFADAVHDALQQSGQHQYLQQILPRLQPLFAAHGAELYDFSSMSLCGASDAEAIDGFHGGEVAYLRLLLKMLEQNSRLLDCASPTQLQADLQTAVNRYSVYAD